MSAARAASSRASVCCTAVATRAALACLAWPCAMRRSMGSSGRFIACAVWNATMIVDIAAAG
jgi:hypothetical protein